MNGMHGPEKIIAAFDLASLLWIQRMRSLFACQQMMSVHPESFGSISAAGFAADSDDVGSICENYL
jgi:hypothetical protein